MKKQNHSLLKVLGIVFIVVIVLSWIIPAGGYSNGKFTSGTTAPIGIFDLFRLPVLSISTFIQYGLVFLAIGGFYGVLNKTGAYTNFVEKRVEKWKKRRKTFLVLTMVLFAVLSSLTGLSIPLFLMVPFFATVLLLLEFDKVTALAATVGAILVGSIGSTYGFSSSGYVMNFFGLKVNDEIFTKVILFAILAFLLIMHVTRHVAVLKHSENTAKNHDKKGKKENKNEEKTKAVIKTEVEEIPLYEENRGKRSVVPMVILSVFMIIFFIIAMYNWSYSFNINLFANIHDAITSFEINGYPIFKNLLGSVAELGNWSNYDFTAMLVLFTLLIGWIYNVKWKDLLEGFLNGAKKMLPVAFYAMLACAIFTFVISAEGGHFGLTIENFLIGITKEFNVFVVSLVSAVGGIFYNDFYTFLGNMYGSMSGYAASVLPITGIVLQAIYGFMMLFVPTSILLVAGLKFFHVSYKEWMKYIWKYLLEILAIIIIVALIASMFV